MRAALLLPLLAVVLLPSDLPAGSFEIPAWAFDRGNVRTFTSNWADADPMVAFGGKSPVSVEYIVEFPAPGPVTLSVKYAAQSARPVDLMVDGKPHGKACRDATGSWNTSSAEWEQSATLDLDAGPHRFQFQRDSAFPHLVALRFDSPAIPTGFTPKRPKARNAPVADPTPPQVQTDPTALRLAINDLITTFGPRYPDGPAYLAALDRLEAQLNDPGIDEQLTALQRRALLANPLLDTDRILLLKREFPKPASARRAMGKALGVGSLNAHTCNDLPHKNTWNDTLTVMSNLRGEPSFETLYHPEDKRTVLDPVLHHDADRILFAMPGTREDNWRIWEIDIDGRGLKQVTPDDGRDVAHLDPCYLPDGRIIFASTAVYQGLPCEFGKQDMTCLYLMDRRSGAIRQLTFEQDSDWCPTLMHNGRVLYLRWEYTDQSHSNSRILFHMNPDGTDQREYRGSGSWFPGSFFYAKPIPGDPHQIIGVASGHHGTPRSGRLLILDPNEGRRDGEGIVQEIPGRGKTVEPIVRDRLVDGVWPQFLMPWPLSRNYHLVAAKLRPNALWGIYLADTFDNLTLIKEVEGNALLWPIMLQAREQPPVIPDRIDLEDDESTVFISDIHAGPGLDGVPRGTVKELRVIEYYFSRRGFGGLYGTIGLDGPWDMKRILGTVPVEPDGSAHFKIPANSPLSLQPLDANGRALQLMRSWFVGMPGEKVSCIGCHESKNSVPPHRPSLAAEKAPDIITPWFGPTRGFNFEREVQPVLDRHCVSCHDGNPDAGPDFTGGKKLTDWSSQLRGQWRGGGKFTEAYYQLQRYIRRPGIEGDRRMFTPLDYHFSTTQLGQLLDKGHYGVTLDHESNRRLVAWFDLNAPFFGTWGEIPQFSGDSKDAQRLRRVDARAMELRKRYVPSGPHPDYEHIPETPAFDTTPVIHPRPKPVPPGPATCEGWPFTPEEARQKQMASANLKHNIALGDGVTLELMHVPGGQFLMGSTTGHADEAPRTITEVQPFWMGRFEITNRQMKQFKPSFESRTEDRNGYQFGRLGYDQDQPDQPAVRVSWDEANAFCQWLSQRSGLRVSLPTEAQWEWACRAGSDQPFSFGPLDADYSPHANLADKTIAEFAADTALDGYEAARPMKNPNRYDDWIPRDDRFSDGALVTTTVGSYAPNAWGLHNMHGNAAEWTRSIMRPYPYADDERNATDTTAQRVIRGGSWRDRPHRATATCRLAYPQWQRPYNTGFRVIIEE